MRHQAREHAKGRIGQKGEGTYTLLWWSTDLNHQLLLLSLSPLPATMTQQIWENHCYVKTIPFIVFSYTQLTEAYRPKCHLTVCVWWLICECLNLSFKNCEALAMLMTVLGLYLDTGQWPVFKTVTKISISDWYSFRSVQREFYHYMCKQFRSARICAVLLLAIDNNNE